MINANEQELFLELQKANFTYPTGIVKTWALRDIDFKVYKNEIVGIVGESGSGKSTLGKVLTQTLQLDTGKILLNGRDITKQSARKIRENKKILQYIFQDAKAALNARKTILELLEEPIKIHKRLTKQQRLDLIFSHLESLGLSRNYLNYYPGNLSGGQAQRIAIAAALLVEPKFLVADEIISALDVSVQSEVLNFILGLKQKYEMSVLFITHDLRVCYLVSDRIAVMYQGRIVEEGSAEEIYHHPLHPYTQDLLSSIYSIYKAPAADGNGAQEKREKPHTVSCAYFERCRQASGKCKDTLPDLVSVNDRHKLRCWI